MERHPAMVYKSHTPGCLPFQHGSGNNLKIRWRRKGTAAPPPKPAALLAGRPPPPETPPAPPGDIEENEPYEIKGKSSRCIYMLAPLPITQLFNDNVFAKDSKHNEDLLPDLLSTLSAAWKYHGL
jgi:hypothetical protein